MRPDEPLPIEYPLLGEPPVVEFINTLYVDRNGVIDFLATVDLTRGWFHALEPPILNEIDSINERDRRKFVELRAAIRSVFDATDDGRHDRLLESVVNASPGQLSLSRDSEGQLVRLMVFDSSTSVGAAAFLADAAITIATADGPRRVRVCDRPACNMRYFQQHRRRRYCNSACANSDRQTRFQQRHKA